MLSPRADALLGVGGSGDLGEGRVGVNGTKEQGLELAHARVDEEESGVVMGQHRRGGHMCVLPLHKVVHERAAYLGCSPPHGHSFHL